MSAPEPARGAVGLPEPVRRAVLEVAAATLGEVVEEEVPVALRKVRAFAPARRARAGQGPLAAVLEVDAAFRQRVAARWSAERPGLAEALAAGAVPPAADPRDVAAGAYLLRLPGWETVLAAALDTWAQEQDRPGEEPGADGASVAALRAEVAQLREELTALRARLAEAEAELGAARKGERRLRADADRARAEARRAADEAAGAQQALTHVEEEAAAAAAEARARVERAELAVEQARRAAAQGRSLAGSRTRLLLDVLVDAAAGLRRELALPPVDLRPADVVAETGPVARGDGLPEVTAAGEDDPRLLDELLGLPQVHLVVDGYNVTKTGYPHLPLLDQRRRLLDGLAALAARTAAEVTCCFDGAALEGRPPAASVRGVRVLFSAPGRTADALIASLVDSEPPGRPVVVVSTDGEVAAHATRAGARAVSSAALVRRLARG